MGGPYGTANCQLCRWVIGLVTYQINLSLATVLHIEDEGLLQASGWVGQCQESLVWSLRGLSVDGGEDQFQ